MLVIMAKLQGVVFGFFFFFQAEDGIRDTSVTGVQTCALPISRGLATTSDGGFVIAGNSKSVEGELEENSGENDIWLVKTDANGNLQDQMVMGGEGLDFGFDILQDDLGNLVLVGESASSSMANITSKGMTDLVVFGLK